MPAADGSHQAGELASLHHLAPPACPCAIAAHPVTSRVQSILISSCQFRELLESLMPLVREGDLGNDIVAIGASQSVLRGIDRGRKRVGEVIWVHAMLEARPREEAPW